MQDAGIEQKHIAFFDRIPFFVHKKAALSGEDDSDFDKIMAVRRFRLLTGKLTGEKKGGIQIFISDIILYITHMCGYLVCVERLSDPADFAGKWANPSGAWNRGKETDANLQENLQALFISFLILSLYHPLSQRDMQN